MAYCSSRSSAYETLNNLPFQSHLLLRVESVSRPLTRATSTSSKTVTHHKVIKARLFLARVAPCPIYIYIYTLFGITMRLSPYGHRADRSELSLV